MIEELLDKSSAIPIYFQLFSIIEKQITTGKLQPGDRLPSEQDLAKTFKISPMTVNKALNLLANKKLVARERGRGTFVKSREIKIPPILLRSLREKIMEQGLRLETKVLKTRVRSKNISDIQEKLKINPEENVLEIQRVHSIEHDPVAITIAYLSYKYGYPLLKEDLTLSLFELIQKKCNVIFARADENIGVYTATKYEEKILKVNKGAPLLLVEGVTFSPDNIPLRYSKGFYRGDRFVFSIQNSSLEEIKP